MTARQATRARQVQPTARRRGARGRLRVNAPGDRQEQEANRIADQVAVGKSAPATPISTVPILQRDAVSTSQPNAARTARAAQAVQSGGRPLCQSERGFFEPRLGHDLSRVRLHSGGEAAQAAQGLGARAYTLGNNIAFASGTCALNRIEGRHLMAHELVHTLQQGQDETIRRSCDDPDFCEPYATDAEADDAEDNIWTYYMAFEGLATFGSTVEWLYEQYLNRSPGDSLDPTIFDDEESYFVSAFRDSGAIEDDMDAVLELVEARINRAPGFPYRSSGAHYMNLSNFLNQSEMDNRPINWSNPFSVAGHVAGGIGSGDAGDDYRKISRANVSIEKTEIIEGTGYWIITLYPHYEVFDTIDFCPGDCGSPAEQLITIPMSRLEAHGRAYDKPFRVDFSPEERSTRLWF